MTQPHKGRRRCHLCRQFERARHVLEFQLSEHRLASTIRLCARCTKLILDQWRERRGFTAREIMELG